ncbi:MAG: hypothetical protein ACI3XI_08355 [Eubacteriales bacterium]
MFEILSIMLVSVGICVVAPVFMYREGITVQTQSKKHSTLKLGLRNLEYMFFPAERTDFFLRLGIYT